MKTRTQCSCSWDVVGGVQCMSSRDALCEQHGNASGFWRRLRAHAWECMNDEQREAALRCAAAVEVAP